MDDTRKKLIENNIDNIYAIRNKIISEMHFFFKEIKITHSQLIVLHVLKKNENSSIKDLADILGITSSAVSQIVNELVKKGFLLRKRNLNDRRTLNLTLSDKSKVQFDSVKNKSFNALYSLFDVYDNDELLQFFKLSNKIIGNKSEEIQSGKD